jgi:UDP-4-amino-4-deoxy-L-arabinose formyltransferase/UDP-glucuronic acid dehydrogenase (UDP-4-keto-hexauronic acid decarboxylating)
MKKRRIVVFSDSYGAGPLLGLLPSDSVACLVSASIRPHDHALVSSIADEYGVMHLVQPKVDADGYPSYLGVLKSLEPDLILCHSYSMIIRDSVLDLVSGNAVNVHAALLPKNRGPNPIQWAIIRGETKTGISIHYMEREIDAGDLIAQQEIPILESDTWVTLRNRLDQVMGPFLAAHIPSILNGNNDRTPQDLSQATVNTRLYADSPRIDWGVMSDKEVFDLIRAQVRPLGGAYVDVDGKKTYFQEYKTLREVAQLRRSYQLGQI